MFPFIFNHKAMCITEAMHAAGYINCVKIADTLQGEIWRSLQKRTNKPVVIKVTQKYLHKQSIGIVDGQKVFVHENIKKEIRILRKLSQNEQCPDSIVRYVESFMSQTHYFLVMEDGGRSLFEFIVKAHRFVDHGSVDIIEWQNICKIILKQMIECIEYLHENNVCHLDISVENFLINDVEIVVRRSGKISFVADTIQIKLCDFGVAETFSNSSFDCTKYCGKTNYKSPEIISRDNGTFCAKSNDIWCMGICFFMLITGTAPWKKASQNDTRFIRIMRGDIVKLLTVWKKIHLTNRNIRDLFSLFFQFEDERASIHSLKRCKWLQNI